MRTPGSIPPGNDINIMHCPPLVVKCFFAFHRFLQKCHDFVICFVRIDESAEAYVRFSPEFPVFVGKPVLYWVVFSMGTQFCMKSYVKLHKRCFADTVPPNASGAADSSAPPVLSVRDAFHRGSIFGGHYGEKPCGGSPARLSVSKSLAEFAARRRQRDFDHFLSGRTPGWSLLPLRGNSPPVPDRKYNSGCKCASCPL